MIVKRKPELLISLGLFVIIGIMFYLTNRLPDSLVPHELGPRFFPFIVLIFLAVFNFFLCIGSVGFGPGQAKEETVGKPDNNDLSEKQKVEIRIGFIFFGVILLGLVLMYVLGFSLGVVISVSLCLVLTGAKKIKSIVFTIIATAVIVILFQYILYVPLPAGLFF